MPLSEEDRKVLEFMEKNYPQYKDNLALGRLLYAKHLGRVARSVGGGEILKVKIKDINPSIVGSTVEVVGLLGHVEKYVFKRCPKCWRKDCVCNPKVDEGRFIDAVRLRMVVGDETGNIDVLYFPNVSGNHDFEVGREVVVRGRVKFFYDREDSDRIEILASNVSYVEPKNNGVEGEGLSIVLDFVRKAKKVSVDIVKKLCEKHGVNPELVYNVFEVRDGYVVAE